MTWTVPLTDLELTEDDVAAYLGCLERGWLTMGPEVQAVEAELAERHGVRHACAVGTGTAALLLSLRALGVGEGDEVVMPGAGFIAAAHATAELGARPVFADLREPTGFSLDLDRVQAAIGPRTRALLPLHMHGIADDVAGLRELCARHGLALVEDCAEAFGARDAAGALVGTTGDAGCLSFFSKKQLACGEGGAVLTDRDDVAAKVRSLRSHAMTTVTWDRHRGHAESYDVVDVGCNLRFDEPRAALLRSRMRRVDADLDVCRERASRYRAGLGDLRDRGLSIAGDEETAAHASPFGFVVILDDADTREVVREHLREAGIQSSVYPAFTQLTHFRDHPSLPNAEAWAARHLTLPLFAGLRDDALERVVEAVRDALRA